MCCSARLTVSSNRLTVQAVVLVPLDQQRAFVQFDSGNKILMNASQLAPVGAEPDTRCSSFKFKPVKIDLLVVFSMEIYKAIQYSIIYTFQKIVYIYIYVYI